MQVNLEWKDGKATQVDIVADRDAQARPVKVVCGEKTVMSFTSSPGMAARSMNLQDIC